MLILNQNPSVELTAMDGQMLADHLATAEHYVQHGVDRVLQQRRLIIDLERDGHDTAEARRLFVQMEDILAIFIADRDRLRAKLTEPAS
jgi:hypothetical protein